MENILTTKRLALRPFALDDAEALFALFSDTEVMRYSMTGVMTRAQSRGVLEG